MSLNKKKKSEDNLKNLELRKEFINLLEKLNDNNTRDMGYKGLKKIILENNNSYPALRIFLNSLMNFNTENIKAKEIIILLFGFIGNIYKNNLLDPIDRPMSLINSINRIVSHIRNKCMKSNIYTILKSCSYSILQILDNCMPKNDINNLNKIFIQPFINDINNAFHLYVKNGCCIYINDLIYHVKKENNFGLQILKYILINNKFINDVILKIKIDFYQNHFLYEALYNSILYYNFDLIKKDSINIIHKMIEILENRVLLKNETKISCLKVLYIIIQRFMENNYDINNYKEILNEVRNCSGNYVDDRMNEIRKVARDIISLLNEYEFEETKMKLNSDENKKHRKVFETMRELTRKNKIHKFEEYDNMIMDNLQNDIYNNGITKLTNLSNFIKKQTKKKEVEKINNNENYLKSNNIKKYDYLNNIPLFEEEHIFKNSKRIGGFTKNKNNIFLTNDNYIEPTNIEETSKNESTINYTKKDNKNYNEKNKIEIDPTYYYSININEIYNSINNSKKLFLSFEKKINSKLYENENKLINIKNSIEKNENNIIKYHNNILNETIKTNYTQTEKGQNEELNNYLLKTGEFNTEGKEYFRVYLKALNLYNNKQYNEAFSLIVDDEIYLLRLLFLAKNKLNFICPILNEDLYQKMILKINHLCHSHFLIKIQNMLKKAIIKKS